MALVSVVIGCRNYGRFLREAIASTNAQTHAEVEVIVVDYGSTDDTREIVAEFPQARCLSVPNRGLGRARNDGLRAGKGEFVVFLDADDMLVPDAIATSLACLEERPECAFVYGHQRFFDGSGEVSWRGGGPEGRLNDADPYAYMLRTNNGLRAPGAALYRRDVLLQVDGFATDLEGCEDFDLNARLARAHPIACNDRIVLMTRVHESNMSRRWGSMLAKAITAQRRQHSYVRAHPEYENDYRNGLRVARSHWGGRLAEEALTNISAGSYDRPARDLLTLLRWAPRTAPRFVARAAMRAARRLLGRHGR
ncbi:MAG TPA: glycosyltransferase [Gaiellaceae bacterium]|nr:glycosyltransferase [Gaiellaceae bacterium]